MKALLARFKASRLGRTLDRYNTRSGAVLAGGVAYAALFSVFGALVAGFSIFGLLLGNNETLFNQVVKATAEALPGLLKIDGNDGAIDPQSLVNPNLFSVAGLVAFLTALFAGLGWVDALRASVRAMFDLPDDTRSVAIKKGLDVVWLASLGLTLLASAIVSLGLGSVAGLVLDALGLQGTVSRVLLRVLGFAVVVAVDMVVLLIVYRWLAELKLPLVRLRGALLFGGVGLALLTQFSGLLVGSAGSRNPLLATGALLVTLLVLFNFISRLMLYLAAWIATFDAPWDLEHGPAEPIDLTKAEVEAAVQLEPTYSQKAEDRTTAAAGFVLGASAVLGVRALTQGARTMVDLVRGR